MNRVFFDRPLDTAASWWRIHRRDGVTLGFTTHDRDLWFGGILHHAAPGMLPSAIRRSSDLEDSGGEVEGALSHDTIGAADLAEGRYDGARIEAGIVDWETLEHAPLYAGTIAALAREAGRFTAELRSAKALLDRDPVPRSGPTCRARFCGPGCALNPAGFTRRAAIAALDRDINAVTIPGLPPGLFVHGEVRWLDGPQTGFTATILDEGPVGLVLDRPLAEGAAPGQRVLLREGCDRTIATCAARFGNALNFQGEPFLPGNDMLAHYPVRR